MKENEFDVYVSGTFVLRVISWQTNVISYCWLQQNARL